MKKTLATGFLLLIIPFSSHAAMNPGVEFLSPLVQTIIGLLQDRIAVLSARVTELESRPSCTPVTSTAQVPVTSEPTQPVLGQVTPIAPVVTPQTVSVSYINLPGDRCPTFTFASDKPFFLERFVLQTDALGAGTDKGGDMLKIAGGFSYSRVDKAEKLKTLRVCQGGYDNPSQTAATFLGSESVLVGSDGARITVPDITFTY
jgi:hypothetical protein